MIFSRFGIFFTASVAALSAACAAPADDAGSLDEPSTNVATTSQAVSLADLDPQVDSFDPLRIRLPENRLRPALAGEILAALQADPVDERETKLHVDEVNVDLGDGEITVRAKGEGKARKCTKILGRYQCTPWISSTVRAKVSIGLGVRNWIVEAQHHHTDISASNDGVDAVIRAFHGKVYGRVNDGIKKALASVDGRDLRAELESKLGMPLPPEAVVNAFISGAGVVLEATQARPPVEHVTYLGVDEVLGPGDSVRSSSGVVRLVFQGDGNLVLYCAAKPLALWSTGTAGHAVNGAVMQGDGNLVMYAPSGAAVWNTRTAGNPGTVLAVQDDGNVVLYAPGSRPIWDTQTNRVVGRCAP